MGYSGNSPGYASKMLGAPGWDGSNNVVSTSMQVYCCSEARCAAMLAAPAGYSVQNLGVTTVSAIGSLTCAAGFVGDPYVRCPDDSGTSQFIFDGCYEQRSCATLGWTAVTAAVTICIQIDELCVANDGFCI